MSIINNIQDKQVKDFIAAIPDVDMRADSINLARIMHEETAETAHMWGSSIVGFGTRHYKYESGREGDTVIVGFSPRKQALTVYGVINYNKGIELLDKLGKHKAGKGCIYIKRLSDVDEAVLRDMIRTAYSSPDSHL